MNGLLARAAASAALLVPLLVSSAAPVLASCAMPIPIEQAMRDADSVFVGAVMRLSNGDRWATVAVEEIWKGPDLAPIVEVRGGPGGDAASSIDRTFTAGTYLFVVSIAEGHLSDNACSATIEVNAEVAALRPATFRQPVAPAADPDVAAPFDPASLFVPAALIIVAGMVVFGGALVLRRKT